MGGINLAAASLKTGLLMLVAIVHTAFAGGIASVRMFKIARMQGYGFVRRELRAGIGVVFTDRRRLNIIHAGAVMQVAGLVAIILRLAALQAA